MTQQVLLQQLSTPSWSPLYELTPHQFKQATRVTILARVEAGTIAALLPPPLEATGDFLYITWLKWVQPDTERDFDCINVAINFPCRFKGEVGKHCALEYIDTDMGLTVGREVFSYPKKSAHFIWEQTEEGLLLEAHRDGALLIRSVVTELPRTTDTQDWVEKFGSPPVGSSTLQVRYFAPDFSSLPTLAQVERVGVSNFNLRDSAEAKASLELFRGPRDSFSELGQVDAVAARIDHQEFDLNLNSIVDTVSLDRK